MRVGSVLRQEEDDVAVIGLLLDMESGFRVN